MVIGNGSIASIFFREFHNNHEVVIFASGVSDSTEKNEKNFEREKKLLCQTIENNTEKKNCLFQ